MKLPSLEDIAARWTPSHTVAIAAWVVALVLGLSLFIRETSGQYPVTDKRKVYAGDNATFTYPANWTANDCAPGKPFIELPGSIKSDYRDQKAYHLTIYGTTSFPCSRDMPQHFDIFPEAITASANPCAPALSTKGEHLSNGLYLQLEEQSGKVTAVYIRQNQCFAPANVDVLEFAFADPKAEAGDTLRYGLPAVSEKRFLASGQYKDIRTLAESIKY